MSEDITALDARHWSADASALTVNSVNLALLDPAKWGWSAGSGIADLLTPHEVSKHNELTSRIVCNC
jgi:hypothetical protein